MEDNKNTIIKLFGNFEIRSYGIQKKKIIILVLLM